MSVEQLIETTLSQLDSGTKGEDAKHDLKLGSSALVDRICNSELCLEHLEMLKFKNLMDRLASTIGDGDGPEIEEHVLESFQDQMNQCLGGGAAEEDTSAAINEEARVQLLAEVNKLLVEICPEADHEDILRSAVEVINNL